MALYWIIAAKIHVVVYIIMYAAFFMLYNSSLFEGAAQRREGKVIGLLLTVFIFTVHQYNINLSSSITKKTVAGLIIFFFCTYNLFSNLLNLLYAWLYSRQEPLVAERAAKDCRKVFLFSLFLMWTTYFLFFLNQFPGSLLLDSLAQLKEALGDQPYENANPLVHTLLLTACVRLGILLFGSANGGVAVYTFVQLTAAAAVFSYTVLVIYQKGYSIVTVILAHLFFNFAPYNIAFAIGMWKDTFFALTFLLTLVRLWVLLDRQPSRRGLVEITLLTMMASLARNSGWTALLLGGIGLCLFARKHKTEVVQKLSKAIVGGVAISLVIMGIVYPLCGVRDNGSVIVGLSVPLQQVGRVVAMGGDISDDDLELISTTLDPEFIKENYAETISDPIKFSMDAEVFQQRLPDFAKLWIRTRLKNPQIYYDAYIGLMKNFWDLESHTWIWDGRIFENNYGIARTPLFLSETDLSDALTDLCVRFEMPLYVLCRSSSVLWFALICLGYTLYQRKQLNALLYLPVLAIFAGLMITAPAAQFRYTYAAVVCLPLLYCLPAWQPKQLAEQ